MSNLDDGLAVVQDVLSVVAIFTGNLLPAATLILQARAENRQITTEEIEARRKITAFKRAAAEAS